MKKPDDVHVNNIHWIDNFAQSFAVSGMFARKDLFQKNHWTAHGLKRMVAGVSLQWHHQEHPSPALPCLPDLLDVKLHDTVVSSLVAIPRSLYSDSVSVKRDVRRIPLKITSHHSVTESLHSSQSWDGLRLYHLMLTLLCPLGLSTQLTSMLTM